VNDFSAYEKRKQAGLEVEQRIKERNAAHDSDTIHKTIRLLKRDFIESTNPTQRKGGLVGFASAAIGLMGVRFSHAMARQVSIPLLSLFHSFSSAFPTPRRQQDAHLYLDKLIPPVLLLLRDPESRVRYYALEALYNFTKVVRGHILVFFNEIFVSLCAVRCRVCECQSCPRHPCRSHIFFPTVLRHVQLYADVDVDVKNGAQMLDRVSWRRVCCIVDYSFAFTILSRSLRFLLQFPPADQGRCVRVGEFSTREFHPAASVRLIL
jgi:vacuole morphology and inheritance protein 14